MGEAINLVNNIKIEKVIFNCGPYNDLEQELIKVCDKKKIPYYSCIKELDIEGNKLEFLNTGEYNNEKVTDENLEVTKEIAIDSKIVLIRKGKKKYFLGIID